MSPSLGKWRQGFRGFTASVHCMRPCHKQKQNQKTEVAMVLIIREFKEIGLGIWLSDKTVVQHIRSWKLISSYIQK